MLRLLTAQDLIDRILERVRFPYVEESAIAGISNTWLLSDLEIADCNTKEFEQLACFICCSEQSLARAIVPRENEELPSALLINFWIYEASFTLLKAKGSDVEVVAAVVKMLQRVGKLTKENCLTEFVLLKLEDLATIEYEFSLEIKELNLQRKIYALKEFFRLEANVSTTADNRRCRKEAKAAKAAESAKEEFFRNKQKLVNSVHGDARYIEVITKITSLFLGVEQHKLAKREIKAGRLVNSQYVIVDIPLRLLYISAISAQRSEKEAKIDELLSRCKRLVDFLVQDE